MRLQRAVIKEGGIGVSVEEGGGGVSIERSSEQERIERGALPPGHKAHLMMVDPTARAAVRITGGWAVFGSCRAWRDGYAVRQGSITVQYVRGTNHTAGSSIK
ncbi:hypothetical protein B0H17DRAFT_1128808 [Mycena rosella]|uniref:Uncharacterized protein n=1 Tax=Mycena rosella TaxID=1033263 RepID=A0AAD7DXQ0_MYCRO|nr:hypothetical protein B0H17DRAFT_1128808 [Mycena rosella]